MAVEPTKVRLPESYVTPANSPIHITNYPESAPGATAIQIVTLNRPAKYNAFTVDMILTLESFFRLVDLDNRIKCIIVTGAGNTFSSGIDLNVDLSAASKMSASEIRDTGGRLAFAIYNCRRTVIAAMNGLAVGIAMTSMLAAGIRIASASSLYGFPFSRIGLPMESASSFFLPRMVGYSNATYLLTTGKTYQATSPVLAGLFAETLPDPSAVLPRALELAIEIAEEVSSMAAYINRQLIWRGESTAEGAHLVDSPLLFDMFAGRDHQEARRSFLKRSKPHFVDELDTNAPRTYPWWTTLAVDMPPKVDQVDTSRGSKL